MYETEKNEVLENLTPKEIVKRLDTYIIGQAKAKKAVAIALRNRMRRLKLPVEIRDEVAPKNILMIGPTGVGKTEIARRLAKLCGAPFLKVEATKYTEVGYVGRDVESMIRDLMAVGFNLVKSEFQEQLKTEAEKRVEERLLDLLLPGSANSKDDKGSGFSLGSIFGHKESKGTNNGSDSNVNDNLVLNLQDNSTALNDTSIAEDAKTIADNLGFTENQKNNSTSFQTGSASSKSAGTREKFREMLRNGKLEEREVEVTVQKQQRMPSMEIFAGGNMEDLEAGMANISAMLSGSNRSKKKTVTIREARQIILSEELDNMTDPDKVSDEAKRRVEQMGIIFIDEIDKIAVRGGDRGGQDVSREGVQRDILPIVEGSNVNTKYGVVDTTHILFIAAGAFNLSKPSDLIPELQGRFPLRVELESLHADEFKRILLEPKNALVKQYSELLATEGVTLKFDEKAIDRMSFLAADVNSRSENIGARRLHTIMELLLEEISFTANEHKGETLEITSSYVDERLKNIVEDQDLSKYIL